jgi:aminomethyltransferase
MAIRTFNPDITGYQAARSGTVSIRMERGVLRGIGADRLDLLHRLSTNATRDLVPGDERSTILTSDKGRIVEVLRILALQDHILLLLPGADTGRARSFLDKYTIMDDFATVDISDDYGAIGLYGERARSILKELTGKEPPDAGHYVAAASDAGEIIAMRDARLNGAGGFLLLLPADAVDRVMRRLNDLGAVEIDRQTYETLRIENGLPSSGRELEESYNPLEAGMSTLISWTKGCYIGQEVIARLDTYDKVQRHLVGLLFERKMEGEEFQELIVSDPNEGKKIGTITSLAYSPGLSTTIALAYLRTQHAIPGARVAVSPDGEGSEQPLSATITKLPFDI